MVRRILRSVMRRAGPRRGLDSFRPDASQASVSVGASASRQFAQPINADTVRRVHAALPGHVRFEGWNSALPGNVRGATRGLGGGPPLVFAAVKQTGVARECRAEPQAKERTGHKARWRFLRR